MYAKHKISSTYILLWDHVNVGCYRTQHFSVVVVHTRTLPFFPHPHCNRTRTRTVQMSTNLQKILKN